jgi:3-hydroxybutyryl-CoA dehydrogenase
MDVDLIIECVPEDVELKKRVFAQIDELAPAHAIIGTNSSSYPVSKIEDAVTRKDKVLNIHFYPPIPLRPMVDIMKGTETSEGTFETGKNWIKSIECTPLVVKKEIMGFVFNRIWRAIKCEVLHMWANGNADVETIDTAWKIFTGMNMGPFELMDGVGLDVAYNVEMSYYKESGDPRDKPPEKFKEKVEKGELGLKSGQGFYKWK